MRVIYWSEYKKWLQCQRWWFYHYVEKIKDFEKTPAMELGSAVDQALNNRMRARSGNPLKEWKPTAKYNPGLSLEGLTVVLREYDARWAKDDLGNGLKPQVAVQMEVMPGVQAAAVVDGLSPGNWIRETKVTDTPDWPSYKHQLLWNTMAAGVLEGQLDVLLKPGFSRPEWAFERRWHVFSAEERRSVISEIRNFADSTDFNGFTETVDEFPRNSNACRYCPHIERCWGSL